MSPPGSVRTVSVEPESVKQGPWWLVGAAVCTFNFRFCTLPSIGSISDALTSTALFPAIMFANKHGMCSGERGLTKIIAVLVCIFLDQQNNENYIEARRNVGSFVAKYAG